MLKVYIISAVTWFLDIMFMGSSKPMFEFQVHIVAHTENFQYIERNVFLFKLSCTNSLFCVIFLDICIT